MATTAEQISTLQTQISGLQGQYNALDGQIATVNANIKIWCADKVNCNTAYNPSPCYSSTNNIADQNNPTGCTNAQAQLVKYNSLKTSLPSKISDLQSQLDDLTGAKAKSSATVKTVIWSIVGLVVLIAIYVFGKKRNWWGN